MGVVEAMLNVTASRSEATEEGKRGKLLPESCVFKLLLSIDRGKVKSGADAEKQILDVYELAASGLGREHVLGIDIAGNPAVPSMSHILSSFTVVNRERRAAGLPLLPVACHLGEAPNDDEISAVLAHAEDLCIRRLGHCTFFKKEHVLKVVEMNRDRKKRGQALLCIEFCPTSNRVGLAASSLKGHHYFKWMEWVNEGKMSELLPITFNADDIGLFSHSLSLDYQLAADVFSFSEAEMAQTVCNAMRWSFLPVAEKEGLSDRIQKQLQSWQDGG